MVSLSAHQDKIDSFRGSRSGVYSDPRTDFIAFLREQGYQPPDRLRVGPPFMKFPCPADTGNKKKGFCIYHEVEDRDHPSRVIGIGIYGNYYDGLEPKKWVSRNFQALSPTQRMDLSSQIEEQNRQYELEKEKSYRDAADMARQIYEKADGTHPLTHPYLEKKKILPFGAIRIATTSLENERPGDLIVPIVNGKDELMSLQFIKPNGFKMHMTGGKKQGCFFFIPADGEKKDKIIYICEGYATAASVHEATGRTVYVSFDCGNLYNVASHVKNKYRDAKIVIAGDDDIDKEKNAGRDAATAAASGLGIECIFPVLLKGAGKDWNDLACSESVQAVKRQLEYRPEAYKKKEVNADDFEFEPPPGMLRNVYDYFNTTCGKDQKGFAVQTALAVVSIFTARNFITKGYGNLTSLYLLCIGKTSTGKEFGRKTIQQILEVTNHENLEGNSGYTSPAGVLSDLIMKPRHINIIDEFGLYLKSAQKGGDGRIIAANVKLMEAFGQLDGKMSPAGYSTLNLPKDKRIEMQNRRIHFPAVTIFGMTVPSEFYDALDIESIRNGFLGRFLIFESTAKSSVYRSKEIQGCPEAIKDWVKKIDDRIGTSEEVAGSKPTLNWIEVSKDVKDIFEAYSQECFDVSEGLEKFGIGGILGKSAEIMLRVALIAALARDPDTDIVKKEDAEWAYKYVKFCFDRTVSVVKKSISGSPFEARKKAALEYLRNVGDKGVIESEMQNLKPFSAWAPRDLKDVIEALLKSELVATKQEQRGKKMVLVHYAVV